MRTVFNLLGPLVNPLHPTGQVIGVYNSQLLEAIAGALNQLSISRAIVLHGREGLDEAGLGDATDLALLEGGVVNLSLCNPQDLGLTPAPIHALKGGEVPENAEILRRVLQGKGTQAQTDVVALNASLALQVGEVVPFTDHKRGIATARAILKSGAAWEKLVELVKFLEMSSNPS